MVSKIYEFCSKNKEALYTLLDIGVDFIPFGKQGVNLVKRGIGIGYAGYEDDCDYTQNQQLEQLESLIGTIESKLNGLQQVKELVNKVNDLPQYTHALTPEEKKQALFSDEKICKLLSDIKPQLQESILQTIQKNKINAPMRFTSLQSPVPEEHIINSRYQIRARIGEGGQGKIYQAYDMQKKREVALKIFPEEITGHKEIREELEKECATLIRDIQHPHIIQYYDLEKIEDKGSYFLSMEYIKGPSLRSLINKGYGLNNIKDIYTLLFPVAEALRNVHANGIIHCDIKPENILITENNKKYHPYLIDFGLSQTLQNSITSVSGNLGRENIEGTIPYMSPEQYEGKQVKSSTDVWALAVIAYEMFKGVRPFQGITYDHFHYLICHGTPRAIGREKEWNVFQQAFSKDRKERTQSAVDFINHLYKEYQEYEINEKKTITHDILTELKDKFTSNPIQGTKSSHPYTCYIQNPNYSIDDYYQEVLFHTPKK